MFVVYASLCCDFFIFCLFSMQLKHFDYVFVCLFLCVYVCMLLSVELTHKIFFLPFCTEAGERREHGG